MFEVLDFKDILNNMKMLWTIGNMQNFPTIPFN